jgi:hypothetical protein
MTDFGKRFRFPLKPYRTTTCFCGNHVTFSDPVNLEPVTCFARLAVCPAHRSTTHFATIDALTA